MRRRRPLTLAALGSTALGSLGLAIFLVTLATPVPGDEVVGFLVMIMLLFAAFLLITLGGGVPKPLRGFAPKTGRRR